MSHKLLAIATLVSVPFLAATGARAGTTLFQFSGAGTSGSGVLTYGADPVNGDPAGALAITGANGTFSDSNIGITNATITGVFAIDPVNPPKGAPFPASFSTYAVTSSDPKQGPLSYDNLLYPGGSPIVCPHYSGAGGFLDNYGVMFTLNNGDIVALWSNGVLPNVPLNYGVAVVDPNAKTTLADYQAGGITATLPEPSSVCLLAAGLIGVLGWRRRAGAGRAASGSEDARG